MKTRILIVEDDPHILMGLEEVLRTEGFEVATCARGDQALDAVASHQPGLILLDVMLPGTSGYDICKKLRSARSSTPILMLTAKGQEMDKVIGLELGADDYVTKPFGLRELLARIHALLRRSPGSTVRQEETDSFQIGPGHGRRKEIPGAAWKSDRRSERQRAQTSPPVSFASR